MDIVNFKDLEREAVKKLSKMTYDYYASGADDEITLRENNHAFHDIDLAYRVLRDVRHVSPETNVLGSRLAMPVLVAPMGFQGLAHAEGEKATARATGKAGTIMLLSTLSNMAMEDVVAAASGPVWFQLYVYKDRELTKGLVQRAEAAGCGALVLTVDVPVLGRRERDLRNRFHLPAHLPIENMLPQGHEKMPQDAMDSGLAVYFGTLLDPGLSWDDVAWLRSITHLPILIKGVVRADDALLAVEHGVTGIVVSNHGGRQLDTAPATIRVLPRIADALREKHPEVTLLMDCGIRRGTDIIKALALGADAVLLGRPVLWGLALEGEAGVTRALAMIRDELERDMALCGCRSIAEIDRDLIIAR